MPTMLTGNMKVKLKRGIVVEGIREPKTDERTYGKPGEIVELPRWEAMHVINCGAAEEVKGK